MSPATEAGLRALDGPACELLALAYIPPPTDGQPYRLALLLHGAGGIPQYGLELLLPAADERQLLLLAPKSSASTWDLIVDGFGPDIRRIDRVLEEILNAYPVDRITVGGFSDDASYALFRHRAPGRLNHDGGIAAPDGQVAQTEHSRSDRAAWKWSVWAAIGC